MQAHSDLYHSKLLQELANQSFHKHRCIPYTHIVTGHFKHALVRKHVISGTLLWLNVVQCACARFSLKFQPVVLIFFYWLHILRWPCANHWLHNLLSSLQLGHRKKLGIGMSAFNIHNHRLLKPFGKHFLHTELMILMEANLTWWYTTIKPWVSHKCLPR